MKKTEVMRLGVQNLEQDFSCESDKEELDLDIKRQKEQKNRPEKGLEESEEKHRELTLVFDSLTGNVESFAKRIKQSFQERNIELTCLKVDEWQHDTIDSSVLLLTHTYGKGQVPVKTESFLRNNHEKTIGVCVSGNRNWGNNFGMAGDKISLEYGIPLIRKFELRGFPKDVRFVIEWVEDWLNKNKKMEGITYE